MKKCPKKIVKRFLVGGLGPLRVQDPTLKSQTPKCETLNSSPGVLGPLRAQGPGPNPRVIKRVHPFQVCNPNFYLGVLGP